MARPADGASISADVLDLDPEAAVDEIVAGLRAVVGERLRKRGAVVGLSGGIDSSVCAALSVRAFGAEHVLGVLMPESDSAAETLELSRLSATSLGIETVLEDITQILDAAGCYTRRDAAIRSVLPDYGPDWKAKIVLPSLLGADRYRLFKVVAESPDGERHEARLTAERLPRGRRLDELQAAHAQDARVPPRRPARLRGRRDAEPARVRPGLLRQAGRRRGRREADRAPLQDAGLPHRRVPRGARDDPHAAADDRHLLAAAEPGGVLLLAPVGQDGSLPLRRHRGLAARGRRRRRRHLGRGRRSASTRTSTRSAATRECFTSALSWSSTTPSSSSTDQSAARETPEGPPPAAISAAAESRSPASIETALRRRDTGAQRGPTSEEER